MSQITSYGSGGGGSSLQTLTGNVGGPVPPTGNNINIVGVDDIQVTGTPGTSTLAISYTGATATQYDEDVGTAIPVGGIINIVGGGNINTAGATNVVTINLDDIVNIVGDVSGTGPGLTVNAFSSPQGDVVFRDDQASSTAAILGFHKSRSNGIITSGDELGSLVFFGNDGTVNPLPCSIISSSTGGTIGAAQIASNLEFYTHPNATTGAALRMGIDFTGEVIIAAPDSGTGLTIQGGGLEVSAGDTTLVDSYQKSVGMTYEMMVIDSTGLVGSMTAPTGGITKLDGNSGSATGSTVKVVAATGEGTSLITGDNLDTLTLTFTDVDSNVVIGTSAFEATHTVGVGQGNVGVGWHALNACTDGNGNTALGFNACVAITTGANNIGIGPNALTLVDTGSNNIAIGGALNGAASVSRNIVIGGTSGSSYTTNESDNILINNVGVVGESNIMRLGTTGTGNNEIEKTFIAGIYQEVVGATNEYVIIDSDGQLGSTGNPSQTVSVIEIDDTDSPYTVLSSDYYISANSTGGVISVLFPDAPATGRVFIVKDATGTAGTNNITLTTVGGTVLIDGATSFVMNTAYESVSVIFVVDHYEVF